jgi:hypothetical protein
MHEEARMKKLAMVVGTVVVMASMVYGALAIFVTPMFQ